MGPMSVSAIASEMLERGWVTREEHTQLLLGDRLYRLHQAVQQQERQRKEGLVRKLSKRSGLGFGQCVRSRSKARKCHKSVAAASKPPKAKVSVEKKKPERPADPCRDPITLDDLGSWTWDFRACEAATPPVSCGGTMPSKAKWSGDSCRGRGRRGDSVGGGGGGGKGGNGGSGGGGGGWGAGGGGSGGSSSAVVTYNVESLVLYLLESGDFQEPTTRRPFSLVQLADLDALAAKAGAKVKGSLVTSYHEGQSKYRERRERREMLVGADRCLGDIVSEMLSTIEDSDEPYEEAHLYLVTLFPQFAHIFSEMKQVDEEFARQCLQQQTAHLRGPPNRPTAGSLTCEQEGLLRTALEFLNEQARAGGGGGSSDDVGRQVERSDRGRADGDRASRGQEAAGDEGGTSGDDAGSGESGA